MNGNDASGTILTAATGIKIFSANSDRSLRRIFTLDTIHEPQGGTQEYLSMVAGTQRYSRRSGDFQVHGNALSGAPVTGQICRGGHDDDND